MILKYVKYTFAFINEVVWSQQVHETDFLRIHDTSKDDCITETHVKTYLSAGGNIFNFTTRKIKQA